MSSWKMLSDYKPKCSSCAPLLQPERRKYLYGGIGIIVTLIIVLIIVLSVTLTNSKTFVLDRTAFFAGRNNLPDNLFTLIDNDLTKVNLSLDLSTDDYFGKNCTNCNTDFIRLRRGKVSSQFWVARASCNASKEISHALNQLDAIKTMIRIYSKELKLVLDSSGLENAFEDEVLGSMIALDGGQAISDQPSILRIYYELGVRSIALARTCQSGLEVENMIEEGGKLTKLGKSMVLEMNHLGMIIDVSGLSPNGMKAVMNESRAPVIISHGAVSGVSKNIENIDDLTLDALKQNGGLLMVTFDAAYLSETGNASIITVIEHINYIAKKIGVDYVGIGGNFDSNFTKPIGLNDVSDFPELFKELESANNISIWTDDALDKLAGLNFYNLFQNVEKVKKLT